ncbi:sialidase family protein [Pollutibacter soli]|uniref:sialidase family protein n=1 Tax=Pollutibacter soli TaxID=3034157 RepID=UPI003013D42B
MKSVLFSIALVIFTMYGCKENAAEDVNAFIGYGQMPNIAKDKKGNLHIVYGSGDSIWYAASTDDGEHFSPPDLVATLAELAASHTRGPQIAATTDGLLITACSNKGDIFSYIKSGEGDWKQSARVNDVDTAAKENLMSLASFENRAFSVWLDLRDGNNKIFGASSTDGGKTWSRNILLYASPDTTVCECCKPSVVMNENKVYVMFRNWLKGNRDLYMITSEDSGAVFGEAQKLGNGSWALKGCPMDGGALVINDEGNAETVWTRKGIIYSCKPGKEEAEIGMGKSCTMETVNGNNVYAWVENGDIIVLTHHGMKKNLGKGHLPVLKSLHNDNVLCVWENDKKIHKLVLEL